MPNPTFKKIQTIEVGAGGSASIDFTSIPSTYTDLVIHLSGRTNRTVYEADGTVIRFNGDNTSGNYSGKRVYGQGSGTPSSDNGYGMPFNNGANSTASVFGSTSIYIPNYAGTSIKAFGVDGSSENNATTVFQGLGTGKWSGTSAITNISLSPEAGSLFVQYSSATLYGLKNS